MQEKTTVDEITEIEKQLQVIIMTDALLCSLLDLPKESTYIIDVAMAMTHFGSAFGLLKGAISRRKLETESAKSTDS